MTSIQPGLIVLHGNQLEQLGEAVLQWIQQNPLSVLEPEIMIVQSNGVAEWLKIAMARRQGVCASAKVMLPARFLWDAYRQVLGHQQVAKRSPLDKSALGWRLQQMLPQVLTLPECEPLRQYLQDGTQIRAYQLATRIADLFDGYQMFRADWLQDWEAGLDQLRRAAGEPVPVPDDQRWQPVLWRAVTDSVDAEQRASGRSHVHQRFVSALQDAQARPHGLPRRVVVFGLSAMPQQTMEALSAMARYTQVVIAVSNPCQYYWGDIIEGRELLRAERRRAAREKSRSVSLDALPPEQLHAHAHPLLAAWGKLGRDFIRMLDGFDDADATRRQYSSLRLDLFSEGEGSTLLQQIQAAIRDLQPVSEHARLPLAADDRSLEFHVAHSAQREVEVLHDQCLNWLSQIGADKALRPRDIVVMVPDLQKWIPAIHAVFGQYPRHDTRYIPYEIADTKERQQNPLLIALEWLLKLPDQRCSQSQIRDLLEVPALAQRFRIRENDLPLLARWIEGAGIRWGLDDAHRQRLGLGATGAQNSWLFGLERMLTGYANGDHSGFDGIAPYAEVAGLDAVLAGSLAELLHRLQQWSDRMLQSYTPLAWASLFRELMQQFFDAADERDKMTLLQAEQALQRWVDDCALAQFDQPLQLTVAAEAWLSMIDEPDLNQRFMSGGVTFCTLMPMRAVPFKVVCLLGMNDGDYPRRTPSADFDLLRMPGMQRPGDRSRREDDRYLMLEALLAARQKLYISWTGRSIRDNSWQPPSVLVSQLRDYIAQCWQLPAHGLLTEHPLQPFSRRYFESEPSLTWAREWAAVHAATTEAVPLSLTPPESGQKMNIKQLADFLKQPVKAFMAQRLQIRFDQDSAQSQDDEPFAIDGLESWALLSRLTERDQFADEDLNTQLQQRLETIRREGVLPLSHTGEQIAVQLMGEAEPVLRTWWRLVQEAGEASGTQQWRYSTEHILLEDWTGGLVEQGQGWRLLDFTPTKLTNGQKRKPLALPEKLFQPWIRQIIAGAQGVGLTQLLVGRDAWLEMPAIPQPQAQQYLQALLAYWMQGMTRPLGIASRSALEWLKKNEDLRAAQQAFEGDAFREGEADKDLALARCWPDFDSMLQAGEFDVLAKALYQPLLIWAETQVQVQMLDSGDAAQEKQDE